MHRRLRVPYSLTYRSNVSQRRFCCLKNAICAVIDADWRGVFLFIALLLFRGTPRAARGRTGPAAGGTKTVERSDGCTVLGITSAAFHLGKRRKKVSRNGPHYGTSM